MGDTTFTLTPEELAELQRHRAKSLEEVCSALLKDAESASATALEIGDLDIESAIVLEARGRAYKAAEAAFRHEFRTFPRGARVIFVRNGRRGEVVGRIDGEMCQVRYDDGGGVLTERYGDLISESVVP